MNQKKNQKKKQMSKMGREFKKVQAAGNDFVLFEETGAAIAQSFSQETIKRLCDRHTGVGADGVIVLWQQDSHWNWRFYNSDGSEADLCGNAARCVGRWFFDKEPEKKEFHWRGNIGNFSARLEADSKISVTWPQTNIVRYDVPEDLLEWVAGFNDHGLAGVYWWNVGVPHLILVNHETWSLEQRLHVNAPLRAFASLGSEGANLTWLSARSMEVVTYERGVESETLACGSGAVAAFLSFQEFCRENKRLPIPESAAFKFPGGVLEVSRQSNSSVWLTGDATVVFTGVFKGAFSGGF